MEIERRLRVVHALAAFWLSLALLLMMSPLALGWSGAFAVIQIVAIGLPALMIAARLAPPASAPLGLSWPRPTALAASVLLGVSTWWLVLIAVDPLIAKLAEYSDLFDPVRLEALEQFVVGMPWLVLVASVVLTPAVCEELLFRGAIARSLTGPLGSVGAIVVSALLFGLFHLDPIRMIPTALLGLVLGYAAVISGSTITAMVIHFINNGLAVAFARLGSEVLEAHRIPFTAAAGIAFLVGIALIWRSRPL
jgi:sodium transport system permease protein